MCHIMATGIAVHRSMKNYTNVLSDQPPSWSINNMGDIKVIAGISGAVLFHVVIGYELKIKVTEALVDHICASHMCM